MSCGCGGRRVFPNSVMARIRAAELATSLPFKDADELVDAADKIYIFVTNGLAEDGAYEVDEILDIEPKAPTGSKTTKESRQAVIAGPILNLPGVSIETAALFEKSGFTTVGALLQRTFPNHSWSGDVLDLFYALGLLGLRIGMTSQEIADWITEGA